VAKGRGEGIARNGGHRDRHAHQHHPGGEIDEQRIAEALDKATGQADDGAGAFG
jgi:hypothetical protein